MYKDRKFKIRSLGDIMQDLTTGKARYGEGVKNIFFSDGNTILMKTKDLLKLFNYCHELFPNLNRITMYGSAQYIVLKSLNELTQLRQAGLSRLHCGMESGNNEVLKFMNKGFTRNTMARAGKLIKKAGIELSLYYIVGLGSLALSKDHAIDSASLINEINPDFIRLRTLIPIEGTPLYELYEKGEFQLLTPYEALRETRLLIENLNNIHSHFLSDHTSNFYKVNGKLPKDKYEMLSQLDYALTLDKSYFRSPESGNL